MDVMMPSMTSGIYLSGYGTSASINKNSMTSAIGKTILPQRVTDTINEQPALEARQCDHPTVSRELVLKLLLSIRVLTSQVRCVFLPRAHLLHYHLCQGAKYYKATSEERMLMTAVSA